MKYLREFKGKHAPPCEVVYSYTNGAASLGCHSKLAKQLTCTQKQKREGATSDK